jgi:hypothetical protein
MLPVFLLAVMLAIVLATVLFLRLAERLGDTGGIRRSEADFSTDVERISFVQQFSPMRIPASATEFAIEQGPVTQGNLRATFRVSAEDYQSLSDALGGERALDGEGTYKFPGPLSDDDQTSYKLDPHTRRVEVYYFDP